MCVCNVVSVCIMCGMVYVCCVYVQCGEYVCYVYVWCGGMYMV